MSDLEEAEVDIEIYKERTEKEIRKMKEREIEHRIRKQRKNMKPIDAMIFRDNYFRQSQEKKKKSNHQALRTYLRKVNEYIFARS
jgi:hypothetical protein